MSIWKQLLVLVLLAAAAAGGYEAYRTHLAPPATEQAARGGGWDRAVSVETAPARIATLSRTAEAVGTTRARQSVEVVPLASGRVVEISFFPGQSVEAGEVLVRLDDDIERADLTEAEAVLVEKRQAVERTRRLQSTNAVAMATLEAAVAENAAAVAAVERARRRLADREIRAPFAGLVGLTDVDLGARVDDDTVITTLDDLSVVEIEFSLPETLFAEIVSGMEISARSAAFPGQSFDGTLASIDSRIDPVSRAFRVRAVVPNPEGTLPSGMFMSLTVTLSEAEALVVPEEAIVVQAADTYVFTVEDEKAVRRPVVTGARRGGVVAIVSGLAEGEPVVTRGLQRVRDGSSVRVLNAPVETAEGEKPGSGS